MLTESGALVEHYVEKNLFARFTGDAINGILPDGTAFPAGLTIPVTFFTTFMRTQQAALGNIATFPFPGGNVETEPAVRIMHAVGSNAFRANFLLLQARLNNMKGGVSAPTLSAVIQMP